jgi:hypothetical protein
VAENMDALAVSLSKADLGLIDQAFPAGAAAGARYNRQAMRATDGTMG